MNEAAIQTDLAQSWLRGYCAGEAAVESARGLAGCQRCVAHSGALAGLGVPVPGGSSGRARTY